MRPGMLYATSSVLGVGTAGLIVAAAWMTAVPPQAPELDLTSIAIPLLPAQDAAAPPAIEPVSAPFALQIQPPATGGPFVAAPALPAVQAAEESGPVMSDGQRQPAQLWSEDPRPLPREASTRLALIVPPEHAHRHDADRNAAPVRPALSRKTRPPRTARAGIAANRSPRRVRIWYGMPPDVYPAPYRSRPVIIMVEPHWR